jgi:hypothetical protein
MIAPQRKPTGRTSPRNSCSKVGRMTIQKMRIVAEAIASAFASGFLVGPGFGGKASLLRTTRSQGNQIMGFFEEF